MLRALVIPLLGVALCATALQGQAAGKTLFEGKGNCHLCHGRNAKGTALGPDLTDGEWLNIDGSVAAMRALIRSGVMSPKKHGAPMPPMGGARLNEREIEALAEYVRSLSPPRDTTRADGYRRGRGR